MLPNSIRDELAGRSAGTPAERLLGEIVARTRPAIRIRIAEQLQCAPAPGMGRLRGVPDVPPNWEWPLYCDVPLRFLAQVRLEDLPDFVGSDVLPATGLLSFFYGDVDSGPFAPSNCGELALARVYHFSPEQKLKPAFRSVCHGEPPSWCIHFEQIWSLPDDDAHHAARGLYAGLTEGQRQELMDSIVDMGECAGEMKLLGYPAREQTSDLQLECEVLSRQAASPDAEQACEDIDAAAGQWELLAQCDMSDRRIWPGGADGYLHFWIRSSDLANSDFSRVSYTFERT
jgi:uncharacterized protein YwqG